MTNSFQNRRFSEAYEPAVTSDSSRIYGANLAMALIVSVAIMAIAIPIAIHISLYTGTMIVGFIPLSVAWLILYKIFRKIAQSQSAREMSESL